VVVSDRVYRQRLETDLVRWQQDGVISGATAEAIRAELKPIPEGVTIATVVAIVGALLIAAAFLALVAANWTAIARPARFAILLVGIATAYMFAAVFDRADRAYLADLCVSVGSIVFGAAIALVGQMYHLGDDFAAGLLLWAAAVLLAAVLTGSRGALAVALVAGWLWSAARFQEFSDVHFEFMGFWAVTALLAWFWNSAVARHLVAVAALAWWGLCAFHFGSALRGGSAVFVLSAGAALLFGGGIALCGRGPPPLRVFGLTLSNYGALVMATGVAGAIIIGFEFWRGESFAWIMACGSAGFVLALAGCTGRRWAGPFMAAASIALALAVAASWAKPPVGEEPWLRYALALAAMLCLVVSGILDDERPRVVAGWIGLAAAIAAITWSVKGSLLGRAAFLAAAGITTVALAILLARITPRERPR